MDRTIPIAEVIAVLRILRNATFVMEHDCGRAGDTLVDFDEVCSHFQAVIPEIGLTELARR